MARRLSSPTLIGRASEMAELEAALERAETVDATLVVIDGEAGVGKSRLVAQFVAAARERGAIVLTGAAIEVAGGSLPYAPFVASLRQLAEALPAEELMAVLATARREQLLSLVPELRTLPWPDEGPSDVPSLSDQTQMFENILGIAERLGRVRTVVIVLEDLHWADRSTLELLVFLVRNVRAGKLLLVTTYRSDAVGADDPIEHVLVELSRDVRTVRIALPRLSASDTAEQIRQISGRIPRPQVLERIRTLSDGNPFFVEELVAADAAFTGGNGDTLAAPSPPSSVPTSERAEPLGAMPPSLRRLLLDRYRQLPAAAREVCEIIAIVGEPASDELIGRVTELSERDLYGALRVALDEHVAVLVASPTGDRYGFRHALLGEAIAGDLLQGERKRIHAAIAARLADSSPEASVASAAATIAHHWTEAGRWPEALSASIEAGKAAIAVAAYSEASAQLSRAVDLWRRVPDAEDRTRLTWSDLLDRAAQAAFLAGDFEGAVRHARTTLASWPASDTSLAGAMAHRRLGSYLSAANEDEAAAEEMATALSVMPPNASAEARAQILAGRGAALMLLGRYRESAEACRTAIEAAAASGGRAVEAAARNYLGVDLACLGQTSQGLAELRQATEIAQGSASADSYLECVHNYAGMLDYVGRSTEAVAVAQVGIVHARDSGLERRSGAGLRSIVGAALYRLGRWQEADAVLREGLALDPRGEHLVSLLRERGRVHVGLGRAQDAATFLGAAAEAAARDRRVDSQTWLAEARAELAIWNGQLDEARDLVANALDRLAGTDEALRAAPLCGLGLRSEADRAELARARRSTADLERATATADRLIAMAREIPTRIADHGGSLGPVTSAELLLCEAERKRLDQAHDSATLDSWSAAANAWSAIPMPYPAAYAHFRAAEAALGMGGQRDRAAAELRTAADLADMLGAQPLTSRIADLARRARITLVRNVLPGDRSAPPVADDEAPGVVRQGDEGVGSETPESAAHRLGLTKREVEILGLVADGYTNRRIAEALFISEKTAGVHLSNILGKLGVGNRVVAGSIARRLGLVGSIGGSVVRTFMFTDIVRSTNLIEAIGDAAWVDLQGWHDRTLRSAFVRSGGEEIDHAGDGFFVAFLTAQAAAGCAISIQRALAEHRRAHGFAPQVRVGIHEGEAARTTNGYAGRSIHEAARIAGTASGGEIVASASTRLPVSVPTGSPRTVELRGLPESVEVVRIDWARAGS